MSTEQHCTIAQLVLCDPPKVKATDSACATTLSRALREERLAREVELLAVKAADVKGDTDLSVKVLIQKDGCLLVLKDKDQDWWGFPGGRAKEGESQEQAVRREVSEELGCGVAWLSKAWEGHLDLGGKQRRTAFYWADLDCDISCIKLSHEHDDYRWAERSELPELDMAEHARALDEAKPRNATPVQASYRGDRFETVHEQARQAAYTANAEALRRVLAAMESAALSEAQSAENAEQKQAKRKRDDDAWLLLLLIAGELAYAKAAKPLATSSFEQSELTSEQLHDYLGDRQAMVEFAESRQTLLTPFVTETADALEQVAVQAKADGLSVKEAAKQVREAGDAILTGRADRVAQTEAQATYGAAQIRILKLAGFTQKVWNTQADERVRPSHVDCGAQGPVDMKQPFANGLQYPGDPNGGPEEVCGCRCWLTGEGRA